MHSLRLRRSCKSKVGTAGGNRTHTPLRALDFESSASASSATAASNARTQYRRDAAGATENYAPFGGPMISAEMMILRMFCWSRNASAHAEAREEPAVAAG